MIALTPSPFEQWAAQHGYDLRPATFIGPDRKYADTFTERAYEAWQAGASHVARMLTESTIDTEALREKIRALAVGS